ncbi:MAG: hypothetical protein QOG80_1999 [Pseudonocardiales bacterium]|nr:hypothetical protein [Pseudonocardiales bacterium]
MVSTLQVAAGIVVALVIAWIVFVLALVVLRPKGINPSEAKRFVPDIVRLLHALAKDPSLPANVRRRLVLLIAYLAMPFDLVPDFIPVLGYADDVIIVAIVLRSVVRRAGPAALERHWTGSAPGLAIVRSLSGVGAR